MLSTLIIKNYALIDNLNITFNNGLSIITGETGAGKSILLGGLSLVLGKRADLGAIKDSAKKSIIEASFNLKHYNLQNFFNENELDYDDETIIRREILPSGKSRAFINDTPVTLTVLQDLSTKLIDIHSQHKTLELTGDEFQFNLIDALGSNFSKLAEFRLGLEHFNKLNKELAELKEFKSEMIKEYDYNSFLLNELEEANLENVKIKDLEEELETLSNVETIQEKLGLSQQLVNSEDIGVSAILNEVKANLFHIVNYNSKYKELYDRIHSLNIELDDIAFEMEDLTASLEIDPSRLEFIDQSLSKIRNLLHKHQVDDVTDLIKIRDDLDNKVSDSDEIDLKIEKLKFQISDFEEKLKIEAESIHKNREEIIPKLISELKVVLSQLGMPNANFKIDLSRTDTFNKYGMNQLNIYFSANKGTEFRELKKAASGGELSRIMLAIKSIISKFDQLPTIIFDEIDTGVSGEISNKMAGIMHDMSQEMQVISITHLPQIAAKGDFHYKVYKKDDGSSTSTYIKALNNDERIVEIAEMLGGANLSNSAIAHAKQLLN